MDSPEIMNETEIFQKLYMYVQVWQNMSMYAVMTAQMGASCG